MNEDFVEVDPDVQHVATVPKRLKIETETNKEDENSSSKTQCLLSPVCSRFSSLSGKPDKNGKTNPLPSHLDEDEPTVSKESSNSKPVESSSFLLEFRILPPRNTASADRRKVYNIKQIITKEEFLELHQPACFLKLCSLEEINRYITDNVYAQLTLIHLRDHHNMISLHKAKLLAYYDYLYKFNKLESNQLKNRPISPDIPDIFSAQFVSNFSESQKCGAYGRAMKYLLTPESRKKIVAYALVIALYIEDFIVDITVLSSDFNVHLKKTIGIAKLVGCHIVKKKIDGVKKKMAELDIPLYLGT